MKFDDLEFTLHGACPSDPTATHAIVKFPNGYGASIITGAMFYTDADHPYELAVLKNGNLCYDTSLTSDVLGYLTKQDVQNTLDLIQAMEDAK